MLAGAVLTNAKLPEDLKTFEHQLKHVEETSRNATTVFFGLLAASLYSWLTIATTTDVALITGTTSSPLPIINTNIALSGFYLAAPLILIAVYCYFHLYLQRLWRGLASLPAVFPDGVELDDKAHPWLLNGLVRKHFKNLELAQRPLTRVENFVSILLAWWVVPFTLLAFWIRFLPRHDWVGTTLHVALIAGAAWFGVYSYRLAVRTLGGGVTSTDGGEVSNQPFWPLVVTLPRMLVYSYLFVYSYRLAIWTRRRGVTSTEEGKGSDQPFWPLVVTLPRMFDPVRIRRAIRSYEPGGMDAAGIGVVIVVMLSIHAAKRPGDDLLTTWGSGFGYGTYADLEQGDISTKPSSWTGREETANVEIAQVKGADLEDRDLRKANAGRAFLVNGKFARTDLSGAILLSADLRRADLLSANLSGAILRGADLRDSSLWLADMPEAVLERADLSGAVLRGADLRGADLHDATLRGANLRSADFADAKLNRANLTGADLHGAYLRAADLHGADLSAADLSGAQGVAQAQLDEACGDDKTQLPEFPPGLTIRTCPVVAPPASPAPPPGSS